MKVLFIIPEDLMADYFIAIPTYKRPELLKKKTLAFLEKHEVPKNIIKIFVANEAELGDYVKSNPEYESNFIVSIQGMMNVRNFIKNYYLPETRVLNIDDDLEDIIEFISPKEGRPLVDFNGMVDAGFRYCDIYKTRLWGIYPVNNPYFMKKTVDTKLRYINGTFWGIINSSDPFFNVSIDDKEDFERTILYYHRYKKVIRLNWVGSKTNYYDEKGGMQADGELSQKRTEERVSASGNYLLRRWPQYCERNMRKTDHFEIKLIDKTKR